MDKEWLVVSAVSSLKLWGAIYALLLLTTDTLFFSAAPMLLVGAVVVFAVLYSTRIPPAPVPIVNGFFGPPTRPSIPDEAQQGLTVKSRLQLMRSSVSPCVSTESVSNNGVDSCSKACIQGPLVIIGHRAAGLDAPENSLSAIRQCKQRGCEAVEFDVSCTKDKVPVLFHDDNLVRIAGIDREITDMTWDELSRIDISVLHPLGERFRGEKVPTFEQAIDLCMSLGVKFIIDLKDDNETVVNAILEAFQRRGEAMYSMAVVSSFYVKVIFDIRRKNPRIIGCMAWRPGYYRYRTWNSNWEQLEPRYKTFYQDIGAIVLDAMNEWGLKNLYWWFVGLSAILVHKDALTREQTYRWTKKGIRTYVWTVNSPLEKLNFVQNVQVGYLTDTLDGGETEPVTP